jgi:hypothetical protein
VVASTFGGWFWKRSANSAAAPHTGVPDSDDLEEHKGSLKRDDYAPTGLRHHGGDAQHRLSPRHHTSPELPHPPHQSIGPGDFTPQSGEGQSQHDRHRQVDRQQVVERAVHSTRNNYRQLSSDGDIGVQDLKERVVEEVGQALGEDVVGWFGYGSFPQFAHEALPGVEVDPDKPDLLLPGRPTAEDDMLPAIRYLWHTSGKHFPRISAEEWKVLLKAVNSSANRFSWRKPASDKEARKIVKHARRSLRRHGNSVIPPEAAEYVFAEMNRSGLVHQAMNLRVFRIAFIDHARELAAPSGLPEIEFERLESWIWGYDFRAAEAGRIHTNLSRPN